MRLRVALRQRQFIRTRYATDVYCVIEFRAKRYTLSDNCRSAQKHVLVLNVLGLFALRACFNADTFCFGITLVMTKPTYENTRLEL
jgi:hypothetical protein